MVARVKPWLADLNPTQNYAARSPVSDLAIVAAAGAGKTRVLSARVIELVETFGVHPSSIVAFTFTRSAAAELGARIRSMGGDDLALVLATTFGAFALGVVRQNPKLVGIPEGFGVADPRTTDLVLASIHEGPLKRPESTRVTKTALRDALSDLYAKGTMPESKPAQALVQHFLGRLADVGLVPPGLLVAAAVRLLKADEAVATSVRERTHVLVDEAHDMAPIEEDLCRFLAVGEASPGRLSIVLDPRQAIFGWRGALGVDAILPYATESLDREAVELPRTYRFGQAIADAANRVAALAGYRGSPVVGNPARGGSVTLCPYGDVGRHLADMKKTYGAGEVAVLVRARHLAADVAGNHADLVANVHDADIEPAWLELAKAMSDLALNPADPAAFRTLYEAEESYLLTRKGFPIFAGRVGRARTLTEEYLATLANEDAEGSSLLWFATNVADPALVTLDDLAGRCVEFLRRHKSRREEPEDVVGPVLEALGVSGLGLRDAADRLALRSETDRFAMLAKAGLIPVSTVHSAKGREWDAVLVVTSDWPWRLSRDGKRAEEWRTLFVAVTRARREVVVAHPVEVDTGGIFDD